MEDYPSLGQLHGAMLQANIIPVFAIAEPDSGINDALDVYTEMINTFFDGSTVARLKDSSERIINLVKENFKKITAEVKMIDTSPQSVRMRYMTSCGRGDAMVETTKCVNVAPGKTIEFFIDIYIDACDDETHEFIVKSIGLDDELSVTIDPICTCECQNNTVTDSPHCSDGKGNLTCGICNCNEESFGEFCQCDANDIDEDNSFDECIELGKQGTCSSRGSCICGRCICNTKFGVSRYSGKYCECDNLSCSPKCVNGVCRCGVCECHEGYTGSSCSCSTAPCGKCERNDLTCNGNGECECGECKCNADYTGHTCQQCDTCDNDKCAEDIECIKCNAIYSNQCEEKCKDIQICWENRTLSKDLTSCMKHDLIVEPIYCTQTDHQRCNFEYNISADEKMRYIVIGECTVSDSDHDANDGSEVKRKIVIIVISSLVACLLPLLAMRLTVYIYDNIEYQRFLAELKRTNDVVMGENELYNRPITTVKNPTYVSSSKNETQ